MTQILGSLLYMAPEIVLGQPYDAKVDVWAIGCIAYIMLTGNAPFFGKTQNDVCTAIVQKTPTFGRAKKKLSKEAMQFVNFCIEKDPKARATAEQLLEHPWLQGNADEVNLELENMEEVFSDLQAFHEQNLFQTNVISYLRTVKLQSKEMEDIKHVFIKLDSSMDGQIDIDEFKKGMKQVMGTLDAGGVDWKDLFNQIDTDGSGTIDYGEFVTAAVNKKDILNEKNLDMMFRLYDKDGDGEITEAEFREVFRGV